jgi:hypothetical protein
MKLVIVASIAWLVFSLQTCHAESVCPWINKATAFGVLGTTEESPAANVAEISSTSCDFTYRDGDTTRQLRITVEQIQDWKRTFDAYKARCGRDMSQLRAIGNDAVMCSAKDRGRTELIVGRVRDNVFTITLSINSGEDSSMSREYLIQRAELVAEQVSGNLF